MDQVARIRQAIEGTTVNDIFLAVVGGALHHYLKSKGELPAASLVALMPMSLRKEIKAGQSTGNEVGGSPVAVHTEIADPLKRLAACRASAAKAKTGSEAMGRGLLKTVIDALPNAAADTFMNHVVLPQLNTTVSNVRGPDGPLYLAGARMLRFYPVSIATDHAGLNHTGFSYNGVLWITAVACRDMLPDPAFYADCMRKSFAELLEAATAKRAPKAKPGAKAPRRKRTAAAKPIATSPRGRRRAASSARA
jgi:WS/DGAT/MGAT family acyltransferase